MQFPVLLLSCKWMTGFFFPLSVPVPRLQPAQAGLRRFPGSAEPPRPGLTAAQRRRHRRGWSTRRRRRRRRGARRGVQRAAEDGGVTEEEVCRRRGKTPGDPEGVPEDENVEDPEGTRTRAAEDGGVTKKRFLLFLRRAVSRVGKPRGTRWVTRR